jgi:hypothetical protein
MALPASAQILRFAQDDSAVARGERVGRALAHVASLLFLKSSVKVVRHKERVFLLWRVVEKKEGLEAPQKMSRLPRLLCPLFWTLT